MARSTPFHLSNHIFSRNQNTYMSDGCATRCPQPQTSTKGNAFASVALSLQSVALSFRWRHLQQQQHHPLEEVEEKVGWRRIERRKRSVSCRRTGFSAKRERIRLITLRREGRSNWSYWVPFLSWSCCWLISGRRRVCSCGFGC